MMISARIARGIGFVTVLAAVVITTVLALGTGQSFTSFLESGYEQELYGAVDLGADEDGVARTVLGGVAFAPDGDVWSAECQFGFNGTRLYRFDSQNNSPMVHMTSTLHPATAVDTMGGCGLVNHPDGVHMYSNSAVGVFQLDASIRDGHGHLPRYRQPNAGTRSALPSIRGRVITSCMWARRVIRRCRLSWTS